MVQMSSQPSGHNSGKQHCSLASASSPPKSDSGSFWSQPANSASPRGEEGHQRDLLLPQQVSRPSEQGGEEPGSSLGGDLLESLDSLHAGLACWSVCMFPLFCLLGLAFGSTGLGQACTPAWSRPASEWLSIRHALTSARSRPSGQLDGRAVGESCALEQPLLLGSRAVQC